MRFGVVFGLLTNFLLAEKDGVAMTRDARRVSGCEMR
jgi:hypothetical protein